MPGVIIPCVLTILGVILFLRLDVVVGQAGLPGAIFIIVLAHIITLATAISLAAITTNQNVGGGGAYFIISRSLGIESGGTIGLVLFFSLAVSVALYVIGFTSALWEVIPHFLPFKLLAIIVTLAVFVVTYISTNLSVRIQLIILACLALSLLSFYIGALLKSGAFDTVPNMIAHQPEGGTIWLSFALFFPAVTGIMAGVSMSGDLKDPRHDIPKGTFIAIAATFVVYITVAILLAGLASPDELESGRMTLSQIAVFSPLIYLGVLAATISSALTSILGAPRVLQALALDKVFPALKWAAKGSGSKNEPRRALMITTVVALVCIIFGDLDIIATVITMFFLITYGTINLAAFTEIVTNNPSFRPEFRYFHWSIALAGFLGCVLAMFLISYIWCIVAWFIVFRIYRHLEKKGLNASWGDVRSGLYLAIIRTMLNLLGRRSIQHKNWRPHIIVFSGAPHTRRSLIRIAGRLEGNYGLLTVASILEGDIEEKLKERESLRNELAEELSSLGYQGFCEAVVAPNLFDGLLGFIQGHNFGPVRSNTVMMGWMTDPSKYASFAELIRKISRLGKTITLCRPAPEGSNRRTKPYIDIWWRGLWNGGTMLLFAYLLQRSSALSRPAIRINRVVAAGNRKQALDEMNELLVRSRIDAEIGIHISGGSFKDILTEVSKNSRLTILGMGKIPTDNPSSFFDNYDELLEGLGDVLLVRSSEELDIRA